MNEKFYQRQWFMWLTLIFLAPLGIFLMWKYNRFSKNARIGLSVVFGLFFIIMVLVSRTPTDTGNQITSSVNTPEASQSTQPTNQPTTKPASPTQEPKLTSIPVLVDILSIAEKSESEVTKLLGEPNKKEDGKWRYSGTDTWIQNCPAITYMNGLIEIKFIEGKAARITITPKEKMVYKDSLNKVLPMCGLKHRNPDFTQEGSFARWSKIDGLYEFSVFNEGGNISYMYAIANEKYK